MMLTVMQSLETFVIDLARDNRFHSLCDHSQTSQDHQCEKISEEGENVWSDENAEVNWSHSIDEARKKRTLEDCLDI
jgi:hypothetical protein